MGGIAFNKFLRSTPDTKKKPTHFVQHFLVRMLRNRNSFTFCTECLMHMQQLQWEQTKKSNIGILSQEIGVGQSRLAITYNSGL